MRIKEIALEKILSKEMVMFLTLSIVSIFAPFFGAQAVTGPLVNATLFLTVIFLGVKGAVLIAVFPSIVALAVGFLPFIMAPFVPFIITGNIVLVIIFNYFYKNFWKGVILSSFFKFLFLLASAHVVSNFLLSGKIATQITTIMSWPQFATALVGGVIAYFVLQMFQIIKRGANL